MPKLVFEPIKRPLVANGRSWTVTLPNDITRYLGAERGDPFIVECYDDHTVVLKHMRSYVPLVPPRMDYSFPMPPSESEAKPRRNAAT